MITCPKCGYEPAYEEYDYSENTKTVGCDECGYKKIYKLKTKTYESKNQEQDL